MIFADASALIAILAREEGALNLAAKLAEEERRLYSGLSKWETIAGLCRSHAFTLESAGRFVEDFLEAFRFRLVPIGALESKIAIEAYGRYGRGRHPAALNFGDCFAYGCAKSHAAALLYQGDDFALTDLR